MTLDEIRAGKTIATIRDLGDPRGPLKECGIELYWESRKLRCRSEGAPEKISPDYWRCDAEGVVDLIKTLYDHDEYDLTWE